MIQAAGEQEPLRGVHLPRAAARIHSAQWLVNYMLPVGWMAMLTGLFWIGDRSLYHKLYYVLIAAPTAASVLLYPKSIKELIRHPLFLAFAVFSAYMMLTLLWSPTDESVTSLLKRPLYVGLLMLSVGLMACQCQMRLLRATYASALIATLGAVMLLAHFVMVELPRGDGRLSGMGALYNPLLTSHVLGAFAAYWLATAFRAPVGGLALPSACLAVLLVAIIATGSRTPLVGLVLSFGWLLIGGNPKRGLIGAGIILAIGLSLVLFYPEALMQRGASYRPAIWAHVLNLVADKPWLGYGFDAGFVIPIPGLSVALADPHNIELAVLYEGGITGFALWALLYMVALVCCWRHRNEPAFTIAGTWLIFGLGAGLTEGAAFMSRPKEHWLLIWLPIAFVYGLAVVQQKKTGIAKT